MKLSKYVYFCAQKSVIKAENNKFQDLINAPRMRQLHNQTHCYFLLEKCENLLHCKKISHFPTKNNIVFVIFTF